ncbi:hypothetical protein ROZALSC1DRAFT_12337 [Rozella allomycis CSF55]|uniref:HOOK N-terminal domain-containing protein n=1 Tax=Rozella allomycis (strain CSF55) TaxID=988480 RepID=A0A4P9YNA3_ROZAC|nr:hypothetical protein ROZALSC1DRAFT_12337 [Rozella allomycis CSF55]
MVDVKCNSVRELSDGVVISMMLYQIEPTFFKNTGVKEENNWALRLNNLKRIHKLVNLYYTDQLCMSLENVQQPDLTLIAKEEDVVELIKFLSLVIGIAIQGSRGQETILQIQQLSEDTQQVLMMAIQGVMKFEI